MRFVYVLIVASVFSVGCRDTEVLSEPSISPSTNPGGSGGASAGSSGGSAGSSASANPLVVKVEDGELEGALSESGQVRSFLGIPYAAPPVAALRWKEPQKPTPWTGTRSAKEFGGRCAQLASAVLMNAASDTEDCLYLNVWTPSPAPTTAAKLPVMVWIHGGGNVNGSTNEPVPYLNSGLFYSGEHLAEKGVVVVSLNYRLGVFGFFTDSKLQAEGSKVGNQGLWDQQFAFGWVQRNIAAFGGDPQKVTIFGESAGSLDVCLHVASPQSRGLFQQAISESGGCTTFQTLRDTAQTTTDKLYAAAGCAAADLACLRAKPVGDLLNAATGAGAFGPIVDSDFLPAQPRMLYDSGDIAKVPYILGSNTDEGTLFTLGMTNVNSDETYKAAVMARYPTIVDQVLQQYPVSDFMSESNPYLAALSRAFGDATLVCSTWDAAVRAAKAQPKVWMYNFDIPANVAGLGATHGSELVYVFGTSPNLMPDQQKTSDLMQTYWTNLAKNADPNGTGALAWPMFSEASDTRVNLSVEPKVVQNFRTDKCKFWQALYDARFSAPSP